VDRVHWRRLTGLRTSLNVGRWLPDRRLGLNQANRYLGCSTPIRRLAPARGSVGSHSRQRVAVKRNVMPEFEFSRATVIGFR
jgi:hypothetical protein